MISTLQVDKEVWEGGGTKWWLFDGEPVQCVCTCRFLATSSYNTWVCFLQYTTYTICTYIICFPSQVNDSSSQCVQSPSLSCSSHAAILCVTNCAFPSFRWIGWDPWSTLPIRTHCCGFCMPLLSSCHLCFLCGAAADLVWVGGWIKFLIVYIPS